VNLIRVAIEALAGVLGGTQSLHTDSFDEALALPTEHAARLALRTQQVIAEESGVVHVADPLGGSWFLEELTDEMERQAESIFDHVAAAGGGSMLDGVVACIEDGWFVSEIADAAYAFQSKIARGEWVHVGVNGYVEDESTPPPTLSIDPSVETQQLARLAAVKQARDDDAVRRALARLTADAADPGVNLMPALIECARSMVTVGESMHAMESIFGLWYERHVA
jgi:methylmalonyl-CoA mutase, N-terminal domain